MKRSVILLLAVVAVGCKSGSKEAAPTGQQQAAQKAPAAAPAVPAAPAAAAQAPAAAPAAPAAPAVVPAPPPSIKVAPRKATVEGLTVEFTKTGTVKLAGTDTWGKPVNAEYESFAFFKNALPVLSRGLTPKQTEGLKALIEKAEKEAK